MVYSVGMTNTQTSATTLTLKSYKSLSSGAFTATIYKDGKRWALVEDDGRGGQPRVEPAQYNPDSGPRWRDLVDAIEADLHNWALVNLPDWYLTNFGEIEALSPSWELGIGYLTEVAEFSRSAKKGFVVRKDDGNFYVFSSYESAIREGLVWDGTTWLDHRSKA